jgi:hypothetical protein
MKYRLLLCTALLPASFFLSAQKTTKTYAITGKPNNNFLWVDIKQVDINTGKINKVLFETEKTAFKMSNIDRAGTASKNAGSNPTGFGVAAAALDTRHNRLYFATMHFSDIRYLDLNADEASFTTVKLNAIPMVSDGGYQPEENHITRMVIGADGYGYALSNDANHLIRFSTAKNPEVTDLGNLVDAQSNNGAKVKNKCTGWGGGMVADAFGNLVVVSASHNVFTVDVQSRVATLKGTITGLPANFTTNGVAVNDEGELVVSSANVFEGLYKFNIKDLAAVKVPSTEAPFNASDLANGNLLSQKEADDLARYNPSKLKLPSIAEAKIFPNPLNGTQFNVSFEDQPAGKYTIVLTDIAGRPFQSKVVTISKSGQIVPMRLLGNNTSGMYLVKILNENRQVAFSDKIVIN